MGELDINIKKLKKNAYRVSKVRGETASRVRVPGGEIDTESLKKVIEIATKYGNGTINITNRQGFEIPGISLKDVDEVNKALQSIIDNTGVNQEERDKGYPASGTRNVVACPGEKLCPFGCYDTKALAKRIDHEIFPNNHHVFLKYIMKDVNLGPKCEMQGRIYWGGKRYDQGNELRKSMDRFSDKPAD